MASNALLVFIHRFSKEPPAARQQTGITMEQQQDNKPSEPLVAYKGFGKDWKCRDYQFKVGETFTHDGEVKACEGGFHSCENPLDVFGYYAPGDSRFALVEVSGVISRHDADSKIASASISIKAELTIPEFIGKAIAWVTEHCDKSKSLHSIGVRKASSATGDRSASSATGDSSASSATGYRSASSATGEGAVALNTGRLGKACASDGGAIVLCEHDDEGNFVGIRCSKVGENGIKPDVFYRLEGGEFVEVA